jgi:hypothetical protein
MRANSKRRDGIREERRTRQGKTIEDKMREDRGLSDCFQVVYRMFPDRLQNVSDAGFPFPR